MGCGVSHPSGAVPVQGPPHQQPPQQQQKGKGEAYVPAPSASWMEEEDVELHSRWDMTQTMDSDTPPMEEGVGSISSLPRRPSLAPSSVQSTKRSAPETPVQKHTDSGAPSTQAAGPEKAVHPRLFSVYTSPQVSPFSPTLSRRNGSNHSGFYGPTDRSVLTLAPPSQLPWTFCHNDLDFLPVGIVQSNSNGHVLYVNTRACEIWQCPTSPRSFSEWSRSVHPLDSSSVKKVPSVGTV